MVDVLKNNGTFFYELDRNTRYENLTRETSIPSVVNTYQNEPQFQQLENVSRNYARTGQQKFQDPFAFKMRPNDFSYDGRNLHVLKTLRYNATKDYPDVITANPLKVAGFY
jgi:hypothetical protein